MGAIEFLTKDLIS